MADTKISALSSGAPAQAGDEYVVARSGANYKLTLTNIAANMPATTVASGNLIVSSGNVGVGTGSPRSKLDVSGSIYTSWSDTDFIGMQFGNDPSDYRLGLLPVSSQRDLQIYCKSNDGFGVSGITFHTGSTPSERMRINSSGNVGIGTASPGQKLEVAGNVLLSNNQYFGIKDTTGNAVGFPIFTGSNDAIFGYLAGGSTGISTYQFRTGNNVERMRITSDGNVGIGTASPAFASGDGLEVQRAADATVRVERTGATASAGEFVASSGLVKIGATSSSPFTFITDNTERMRIDSSGDVGIGRTPAASTRFTVKASNNGSGTFAVYVENTTPTELFKIRDDGVFYTGLAGNSPYNLTTGSAANAFVDSDGSLRRSTSSLRYKSDVTSATHGLADVLKLRSVTYKGNNDGETVFGGLIAEEVHDAGLTEFVAYDKEGRPDALHYGNMVALLVKAIQELEAKVAALEAK